MSNGKFTIDEYKRMEKFLGCDRNNYEENYKKILERKKQKYGKRDDQDFDVGELLKPWENFFKK